MRDPNDPRDTSPRIGSPLWIYLTTVTGAGCAALALAMVSLAAAGLPTLLSQPLLPAIAVLSVIGELRPIVTPGKSRPDSGDASLTFCFAALLYWGFPVAALVRLVTSVIAGVIGRGAVFRTAFNTAQYTLSLSAPSSRPVGSHGDSGVGWMPAASRTSQAAPRLRVYCAVLKAMRKVAPRPMTPATTLVTKRTSAATGNPQYSSAAKQNVSEASPESGRDFPGVTMGRNSPITERAAMAGRSGWLSSLGSPAAARLAIARASAAQPAPVTVVR